MTDSLKSADLENIQLSYFLSFPFAHFWWWKSCIDVFSDCDTGIMKLTWTTKEKCNSLKFTFLVFLIHSLFFIYFLPSNLCPLLDPKDNTEEYKTQSQETWNLLVGDWRWPDGFPSRSLTCNMQVVMRSSKVPSWLRYSMRLGCTGWTKMRPRLFGHRDTMAGP